MDPLVITVAAVGAELTRAEQPNLPLTPDEIAADAAACRDAGASIYHLHVRDESGDPTMDVEAYRAAHDAIRQGTDLIVQFSTGGAVGDDEDRRVAPLDLKPEMATLTTGSVNFGGDVFLNPAPFVARLHRRMCELGVLPEFEIFDVGMLDGARRVYEETGVDHHRHYDFVLGVPGGLPAWEDALGFLTHHLPEGATWSATGIGRAHLEICRESIARGGHVRTGLEDVRFFAPGELARSNRQLVERVVQMGTDAGRLPASPDEARKILKLSGDGAGTLPP